MSLGDASNRGIFGSASAIKFESVMDAISFAEDNVKNSSSEVFKRDVVMTKSGEFYVAHHPYFGPFTVVETIYKKRHYLS